MNYKFKITKPINPFIAKDYSIGFQVSYDSEPLWWTESGFKNLSKVNIQPVILTSYNEAETLIKEYILNFIKRYRTDQIELIRGW